MARSSNAATPAPTATPMRKAHGSGASVRQDFEGAVDGQLRGDVHADHLPPGLDGTGSGEPQVGQSGRRRHSIAGARPPVTRSIRQSRPQLDRLGDAGQVAQRFHADQPTGHGGGRGDRGVGPVRQWRGERGQTVGRDVQEARQAARCSRGATE